jgi:hypothetical protein
VKKRRQPPQVDLRLALMMFGALFLLGFAGLTAVTVFGMRP